MAKKFTKKGVSWTLGRLEETFPDARPELVASDPFEMLVATILSVQYTSVRINMVIKEAYKKCKTLQDLVDLEIQDLEPLIQSCGFYRNKARNIVTTAKILVEDYRSQISEIVEELVKFPGVGQKTANVVASTCFGVDIIAVDTHVFRTSSWVGLAKVKTVGETEIQLQRIISKDRRAKTHHLLIFLGRRICAPRSPKCEICPLAEVCHYYHKNQESKK